MGKEAAVILFIITRHPPGGPEENHEENTEGPISGTVTDLNLVLAVYNSDTIPRIKILSVFEPLIKIVGLCQSVVSSDYRKERLTNTFLTKKFKFVVLETNIV